ncbi:hypothetical protein LCGC14_1481260 [marine sediment metagenome]|uniref:Periplasmic copper-binding protein NosD beta helix domain-containing protein n=1 Tax=marine sediment metagenome TaxID=412755 RepID=A0A0F9MBA6_9ZZZZ
MEHNTISQFTQSGIRLRWFSHYNTISRNTVLGSGSIILIGDSSKNTVLKDNNPIGYYTYEDLTLDDGDDEEKDEDNDIGKKDNINRASPIPPLNFLFIGLFLFVIITVIAIVVKHTN